MTVIAAVRGSSVNFPLFLHVLGAMLLVGTLLATLTAIAISWRRQWATVGLTRFGLRMLPFGVVPAYVLMQAGAEWTRSRENLPEPVVDATWILIGYLTAEVGAVVIVVALILAVIGLRKLRTGNAAGPAGAAGALSGVLVAAYVVAVWAMSTKPD